MDFIVDKVGSNKISKPRHLSAKSIQNTWATLSNFWKWASAEFGISNPFGIPFIKTNTKPIDPIPQEEIEKLLKACNYAVRKRDNSMYRSKQCTAKRDKALILVLLDTGLRVSEVCGITIGDVDFKSSRIFVTGKGDKSRYVYFGQICGKALWRYFVERFPSGKAPSDEPFFVTVDGSHLMDRHSVRLLVSRLGKKVGDPNLHPHRFRHTFAIQFPRNGGNVFELQMLLGHTTQEMVQHYARLAEMDLEKAAQRSSPADNWKL